MSRTDWPEEWTAAQIRATQRLESAFAAADRAGLAVCGMDASLIVYRAEPFDELDTTLPSAYEVQLALIADDDNHDLVTHGVYRESGGW